MLSGEWLRSHFNTSLTENDKGLIFQEYGVVFGRALNKKCDQGYKDAIVELLNRRKMESKYLLKSGIAFRYKGKVYTNANLTDVAAEWYIKGDLNRRNDFHELGKDWDEYESDNKSESISFGRRKSESTGEI